MTYNGWNCRTVLTNLNYKQTAECQLNQCPGKFLWSNKKINLTQRNIRYGRSKTMSDEHLGNWPLVTFCILRLERQITSWKPEHWFETWVAQLCTVYTPWADLLWVPLPFSHQHLHIFFAQWKHSWAPWFTALWCSTASICLLYDPGLVFRNVEQEGTPHWRGHLSNHSSPFNPNFHPKFYMILR